MTILSLSYTNLFNTVRLILKRVITRLESPGFIRGEVFYPAAMTR
jgi:hypothetical protein